MNSQAAQSQQKSRPKVFLCHSSKDKEAVRKLYVRLQSNGFKPWFGDEDLIGGQNWQEEVEKAVRMSDFVVVCLSQTSVSTQGFAHKEIKIALDEADRKPPGTIYIIPVRLEEVEIPKRLMHLHCVNLFQDDGYHKLTLALNARQRWTLPQRWNLPLDLTAADAGEAAYNQQDAKHTP
jgi:hypothetical protein